MFRLSNSVDLLDPNVGVLDAHTLDYRNNLAPIMEALRAIPQARRGNRARTEKQVRDYYDNHFIP
ncbi:hypothetical protein A2U01_0035232, partial [Trifolium medium]|nr:hypothetical protein [Trifolium medium]